MKKLENKKTFHPTIEERWDHIEQLLDDWEQQNDKMIGIIDKVKKMIEFEQIKIAQIENICNNEK